MTPEIQAALDEEVLMLFDDLHEAIKTAIDGCWSMKCDWALERIVSLVGVGAKAPELRSTQMSAKEYASVVEKVGEDSTP